MEHQICISYIGSDHSGVENESCAVDQEAAGLPAEYESNGCKMGAYGVCLWDIATASIKVYYYEGYPQIDATNECIGGTWSFLSE